LAGAEYVGLLVDSDAIPFNSRLQAIRHHVVGKTQEMSVTVISVSVSVNIWQSYKQERGCLLHFARLANTPLRDEESARNDHVLARNFAK